MALLAGIRQGAASATMSARFLQGMVRAVAESARQLCLQNALDTVVLGGGVFQNRLILEGTSERLRAEGLGVLSPEIAPANDGGLALGQAAVAAARLIHPVSGLELPGRS